MFLKLVQSFFSLFRMKEALRYNKPDEHVTLDVWEGIAKLGDLLFRSFGRQISLDDLSLLYF